MFAERQWRRFDITQHEEERVKHEKTRLLGPPAWHHDAKDALQSLKEDGIDLHPGASALSASTSTAPSGRRVIDLFGFGNLMRTLCILLCNRSCFFCRILRRIGFGLPCLFLGSAAQSSCEIMKDESDVREAKNTLNGGMVATICHEKVDAVRHTLHLELVQQTLFTGLNTPDGEATLSISR